MNDEVFKYNLDNLKRHVEKLKPGEGVIIRFFGTILTLSREFLIALIQKAERE